METDFQYQTLQESRGTLAPPPESLAANQTASASTAALPLVFADVDALRAAYMPWIRYGGLFLRSSQQWPLGQCLPVRLRLPDDHRSLQLSMQVVWRTPAHAQNGKPAGCGLQLPARAGEVRARIQTMLLTEPETPVTSDVF